MKISSLLLTLTVLFALPAGALAHDFHESDNLFFNTNNALYRQRLDSRPWQLVALPPNALIRQSLVFNDQLWLAAETGPERQEVFNQDRSLRFLPSSSVGPAAKITLRHVGRYLAIFAEDSSAKRLYIVTADGEIPVSPVLLASADELSRLVELEGKLYFLSRHPNTATVYSFDQQWEPVAELPCAESIILRQPQLLLACADGSILKPVAADSWPRLDWPLTRQTFGSESLLAGWDLTDDRLMHFWSAGEVASVRLPVGSGQKEVEQIVMSGERVLLKTAEAWLELLWRLNTPKLSILPDSQTASVVPAAESGELFLNGISPLRSAKADLWQPITVRGDFNHAQSTPLGTLIWRLSDTVGSLTQFAPTPSNDFTKVNPWSSTTSPIQAIVIGEVTSFISVINSSGNANLYQTTDFVTWSRLTLPTKPTFAPKISEARTLPVGSLVELQGVLTVGPKIVLDEVAYLEDAAAGMQIFLSRTLGALPSGAQKRVVATGEISASVAKRLTLGSLADLEIFESATLAPRQVSPAEAEANLGRSVVIAGSAESVETDAIFLRRPTSALKLHFTGAKLIFRADDQLQISAVADWNAASGKMELWATSGDYQLISRAPIIENKIPDAVATARSVPTVSTGTKQLNATITANASDQSASSTVKMAQVEKLAVPTPKVLVGATKESSSSTDQTTTTVSLVSLVAGLTAMRGRRLRSWLSF